MERNMQNNMEELFIKAKKIKEIEKLEKWFIDYDRKVNEYNRCVRMGILCEHNIVSLDLQAEQNRIKIRKLKEEFKK